MGSAPAVLRLSAPGDGGPPDGLTAGRRARLGSRRGDGRQRDVAAGAHRHENAAVRARPAPRLRARRPRPLPEAAGRGSFNATGPDGDVRRWTLGPAAPGSNEETLDRVRYRDHAVDLRTVREPARTSLSAAYPDTTPDMALATTHDVLIHLHRVRAARLRDR
ncbi:erythromycin esterase family protein [Streptomyces sp. NPDC051677]|uniref:erythromycin esterase family protein n=1 Tax=Streptomyces sp. NPDC051677 TaxID=3365669 RepID=UPI0037D726B4